MTNPSEQTDKKPIPETELPLAEGHELTEQVDETKEQDLDELSHANLDEKVDTTEEVDPDDAVHKLGTTPTISPDSEKDPDDLVHGL